MQFGPWSVGQELDTLQVHGCVIDMTGKPLAESYVESIGVDYNGSSRVALDARGQFNISVGRLRDAQLIAGNGSDSSAPMLIDASRNDVTLPTCLVIGSQAQTPTIGRQPVTQVADEGEAACFQSWATGSAPLSYQWRRDGVAIAGATHSHYCTTATGSSSLFSIEVSNAAGSVISQTATLDVKPPSAPVFDQLPESQSVPPGSPVGFIAVVSGSHSLAYQWLRDGVEIDGATSAYYTLLQPTSADNGARFSVRVTNPFGTVVSTEATLTVDMLLGQGELFTLLHLTDHFYQAMQLPFQATDDDFVFVASTAVCQSGSSSVTMNGLPPQPGKPANQYGTLAAVASNCLSGGTIYSGKSSVDFDFRAIHSTGAIQKSNITDLRQQILTHTDGMGSDITANGQVSLLIKDNLDEDTEITITPTPGATLKNNQNGATVTFLGGSMTSVSHETLDGTSAGEYRYDDLHFQVNGVDYLASGYNKTQSERDGRVFAGSGEIVLSSNGKRVGRVYVNEQGELTIEVLEVVQIFEGQSPRRQLPMRAFHRKQR